MADHSSIRCSVSSSFSPSVADSVSVAGCLDNFPPISKSLDRIKGTGVGKSSVRFAGPSGPGSPSPFSVSFSSVSLSTSSVADSVLDSSAPVPSGLCRSSSSFPVASDFTSSLDHDLEFVGIEEGGEGQEEGVSSLYICNNWLLA